MCHVCNRKTTALSNNQRLFFDLCTNALVNNTMADGYAVSESGSIFILNDAWLVYCFLCCFFPGLVLCIIYGPILQVYCKCNPRTNIVDRPFTYLNAARCLLALHARLLLWCLMGSQIKKTREKNASRRQCVCVSVPL